MVTNATGPVKCTWAIGTRPAVAVSRAAATPRDLTRDIYVCGCHNRQGGPIPTNIYMSSDYSLYTTFSSGNSEGPLSPNF